MPELPEVERAAKLVREVALGNMIIEVETVEDNIVYSGSSHTEFARSIKGRRVTNVGRYGKVFYLELDGKGKMPVLHFGMTGMLQVKGQLATYYKETPRKASTDSGWPPRFMKACVQFLFQFILHIQHSETQDITQLAFLDARRLGRIRLCASPLTEPPISALGFDPILSMPDLAWFKETVLKRRCPIKALLLDQSFSAGVGNWVADEILYHARVHPEERSQGIAHAHLEVCRIAVEVNADDSKFLTLPDGKPATIKWVTVGGRTSAYVAELQRLSQRVSGRFSCSAYR
ncbi:Formamidopyrimidine-DNA glycosylase N-terminal domain-containing protein [Fomitopsis serialis]|uniref:Formamidopyrimidine-DNA glycosylase N-terminal domain-containing protein n=1 Tax=Fomitopsis serialis TaxID=139415 RepID=UPI002007B7A7|nr:Formamidopyrimidine-DNA glycosylase N-terminal domain-containing protein [Neoantrodia serialis]KAH9921389.1 Formamidopyrimidine-DNA glycosylase N-terminal domain-containing protein [Neoantrodia serialis]